MEDIEKLWGCACNGNNKELKKYFESGGVKNQRYHAFQKYHSLIAGAYRNRQYETVKYLLSIGETITEKECGEIQNFIDIYMKGGNEL